MKGENAMAKIEKPAAKIGRPSSYTPEVGDEICRLISEGQSMRQALLGPEMPDRNTVMRWAEAVPEFRMDLARARETCADWHADQGLVELQQCKGQSKEHVAAAREIAKYHLSLAKVIDPSRYSDRVAMNHTIEDKTPPKVIILTIGPAKVPGQEAIDVEPIPEAITASCGTYSSDKQ